MPIICDLGSAHRSDNEADGVPGYFRARRARDDSYKYMHLVRWGSTFMTFGFIARFSRRDGISAWSWLFETLVSYRHTTSNVAELASTWRIRTLCL